MIPVVMLGINTGALSSEFLTLFLPHYGSSLVQHIPVIYLTAVAVAVIVVIPEASVRFSSAFLVGMVNGTLLAHFALSLLINIYATSIIALKAWCVHFDRVTSKLSTYRAFVDDTTRAYIQETP
jgi:hypothetical protein